MRRAKDIVIATGLACGIAVAAGLASAGDALSQQKSGAPAPTPSAPAPLILPDPPTPVVHARAIGLGQCASMLDLMSRQVLTSHYDVQSTWSRINPSQHIFQSVAALTRPQSKPPDGIAALVAAPVVAGGCDGVAVQIFPLAGDCQNAQKFLLKGGKTIGPLVNTRIMQDKNGNRIFLLPGFAGTCIAIAVDSHFAHR